MTLLKENWFRRGNVKNKGFLLLFLELLILGTLAFYFLRVSDIGITTEWFVKRDFTKAFQARMAGNCDKFGEYIVSRYRERWVERCLDEKRSRNDLIPIGYFEIKEISMNGDKAFLQVALTRRTPKGENSSYDANYEMKKLNEKKFFSFFLATRFVINQGLSN